MTPRRVATAASITALMALLIFLLATRNPLGGWMLSLALPVLVVYGIARRRVSGHTVSSAVRPAAQGLTEVQDIVLNRPGVVVTYGSPVREVATEHDPRFTDPMPDEHDQRDGDSSRDRG